MSPNLSNPVFFLLISAFFAFGCETSDDTKVYLGDKPFGSITQDKPIQEIVAQTFVLQDFEALLTASKVSGELSSPPYTFFAPWDVAFEALPYWEKITRKRAWYGHLRDLALSHLHAGNLNKEDLYDDMTVTMLNGDVANITKKTTRPRVDNISIIADVAGSDGHVFMLDEVREPKWAKRTVLDIINGDQRFSILSQILTLPSMSAKREELQSIDAEFTFFAPTNEALSGFDIENCTDPACLATLDLLVKNHLVDALLPKLFSPTQSLTNQSGSSLNWDFDKKSLSCAQSGEGTRLLWLDETAEEFALNGIVQPVKRLLCTELEKCTTQCRSDQCGTIYDGCGGTLDCGSCTESAGAINLSYGKNTSQSSTDGDKVSGRAVDGSYSDIFGTALTQYESDPPPWWELDLGNAHYVESVLIHGSHDETQNPSDFIVSLLSEDGEKVIDSYYHKGRAKTPTMINVSGSGVYSVRIELSKPGRLRLMEVKVNGPRICTPSKLPMPAQLEGTQSYTIGDYPAGTFMPEKTGNYLIITTPEVEPLLTPLIGYRSLDYNVKVVNTDTIGNCNNNIKAFIQTQYNNPETRPEFLLLAMKPDRKREQHSIPWFDMRSRSFPSTDNSKQISYSPYAMLKGNDNIHDVYMGIFAVQNENEVTNILNKIKFMESHGHEYNKRSGFYASLGENLAEEYSQFLGDSWSSTEFYHDGIRDGLPTTQEEIDALDEMLDSNLQFLYIGGHGTWNSIGGLCTNDWNGPQVGSDSQTYPVVFANACSVGKFSNFDGFAFGPDAVYPEHVVFGLSKAAVGMAASSEPGGGSDYEYGHGFASALGENVSTMGAVHHLGLINTLETDTFRNTLTTYETLIIRRHLWGDPATQLFGRDRLRDSSLLHVVFGDGDGVYSAGDEVEINAEEPTNAECRFVQWTGDTEALADDMRPSTTAKIGERDIMVEANYRCEAVRDIPGTVQGESFSFINGSMPQFHKRNVVGMLCEDESVEYTVEAQTTGDYTLTLNYATASDDLVVTLLDASSDKELGSETLPQHAPPGFATYRLSSHEGRQLQTKITAPAGQSTFRIRVESGCMSIDSLTFSLAK